MLTTVYQKSAAIFSRVSVVTRFGQRHQRYQIFDRAYCDSPISAFIFRISSSSSGLSWASVS